MPAHIDDTTAALLIGYHAEQIGILSLLLTDRAGGEIQALSDDVLKSLERRALGQAAAPKVWTPEEVLRAEG